MRGFITLVSYCSTCCNPITYCFMNQRFRAASIALLGCQKKTNLQRPFHDPTSDMRHGNKGAIPLQPTSAAAP
ncbi:unnamed protein product [Protopolystoma xenopodis]|uniref:G-protein coupled receptors family 1 profile domain-containing protein n=1 Tax=Protopolystoma xenopodis TaxID=117903 RepID=A0A3S5A2K3_9PLAT|nr:unnamed protein product [Protopolystoma xenopodis]